MKLLIMTGPPFSGKGTQCQILHQLLDYKHISTGDLCRLEENRGSELGKTISTYTEKGGLVPDPIMKQLFCQAIDENIMEKGIILDGYPRTIPQVNDLIEIIAERDLKIDKVINLEVPDDLLLDRAKERAKNSERKDDQDADVPMKRLKLFKENSKPAIAYMKSRFDTHSLSGIGSIEEIANAIKLEISS